jgi:amino acid transporter
VTAFAALLMTFSMIINESLVARTFGTYTLQLFDVKDNKFLVPALGVGLLILAFLINILGNKVIGKSSLIMAILKTGGLLIFAGGAIYASGFVVTDLVPSGAPQNGVMEYLGALALSILAYKGFTTITNSGGEIVNPHKNVSKTIIISLSICAVVYLLVSWGVTSNLSISEIVEAKDYSLAEASRPLFGKFGLWFTVGIAIIATVSGVIASIFAVSRMTTMLTDMKLIPHSHFGMKGSIQKHMLVYVVVIAITLTIFFDLTRIASLGAIYYLVMDIIVHWGVLRNLKNKIDFKPWVVISALVLDFVVLFAFVWIKIEKDPLLIGIAVGSILLIFFGEKWFLKHKSADHEVVNK